MSVFQDVKKDIIERRNNKENFDKLEEILKDMIEELAVLIRRSKFKNYEHNTATGVNGIFFTISKTGNEMHLGLSRAPDSPGGRTRNIFLKVYKFFDEEDESSGYFNDLEQLSVDEVKALIDCL